MIYSIYYTITIDIMEFASDLIVVLYYISYANEVTPSLDWQFRLEDLALRAVSTNIGIWRCPMSKGLGIGPEGL